MGKHGRLNVAWCNATPVEEGKKVWFRRREINAAQCYTTGTVTHALQPVVVRDGLRNVPADGIYSWDPGAYFGMYHPDTFWFDTVAH